MKWTLAALLPVISVAAANAVSPGRGAFVHHVWAALPVIPASTQDAASRVRQTEADDYTRYELLDPDTARFRILYDVTATTPGARFYFNPIRKGSEASDEAVIDLMTGEALEFDLASGAQARAGGHPDADPDTSYIRVHLPRPVPRDGEVRLRIHKTYKDPKSYFREGDVIVFSRSLGIKRNAVVIPRGYELIACNVPSQILPEPDGRTTISFMNTSPAAMPLVVKARPVAQAKAQSAAAPPVREPAALATQSGSGVPSGPGSAAIPPLSGHFDISERAFQDREIVYFLRQPETHAFDLYHDYTERRAGTDRYLNIVRAGSAVANPAARVLDTGESLKVETLKGDSITQAKIDIGEPVRPDSEVVVIRFDPVRAGRSVRLRISETYTDAARYGLVGEELVWRRSFGRPRNAVVLPHGWYVTASSIPAIVSGTDDGRIRLDFDNPRPDEIDVFLKARRRAARQWCNTLTRKTRRWLEALDPEPC